MEHDKFDWPFPQDSDTGPLKKRKNPSAPLRLTDPAVKWQIDDGVVNGVIAAAVWSVERRPEVWGAMIKALDQGVQKTPEGTVNAFLFRAMVDRLLEEFHQLED